MNLEAEPPDATSVESATVPRRRRRAGALMRGKDWASTPLGPPDTWPQSLQDLRPHHAHLAPADVRVVGRPSSSTSTTTPTRRSSAASIPRRSGSRRRVVWREIWDEIGPARALARCAATRAPTTKRAAHHGAQRLPGGDLLHVLLQPGAQRRRRRRRHHLRQHRRHASASSASASWRCCASSRRAPPTRARGRGCLRAQRAALASEPRTCRSRSSTCVRRRASAATLARAGRHRAGPRRAPPSSTWRRLAPWPFARGAARAHEPAGRRRSTRASARCPPAPGSAPPDAGGRAADRRSGETRAAPACWSSGSTRSACSTTTTAASSTWSPADRARSIANAEAYEEERQRAEALAELDRAKTAFFSNVSHEFRTPLTLMLGPLEDALRAPRSACSPARTCDTAHRNALRLLKLVNTLLDFSRIEAGRVEARYRADRPRGAHRRPRQRVPLGDRAGRAAARGRLPAAAPSRSTSTATCGRRSSSTCSRTRSSSPSRARSACRCAGERRARASCAVRDTGTGIAADELPRVFERFHRVRRRAGRTHEGTGIGLALVQELVQLHGGTVAVEQRVGRGHAPSPSRIPLRQRASAGRAHRGARALALHRDRRAAPSSRKRCAGCPAAAGRDATPRRAPPLAARDGDRADRRAHRWWPTTTPTCATTSRACCGQRWRGRGGRRRRAGAGGDRARNAPDLVLTDVMMPRLDGFGLLRALRADPRLARHAGHHALGARGRGGARRGPRRRRRRLPGQAVLARASCWRASLRRSSANASRRRCTRPKSVSRSQ